MQHKIVIRRHRPWLRAALIGGACCALVLGGWALYSYTRATTVNDFARARGDLEQVREERRRLSRELRAARGQIEDLNQQLAYASRSRDIDGQACETVRRSLSELQTEALDLREQIAFYRAIVSPEQARAGVRVQALKLRRTSAPDHYRYALTLIQSVRQEKRIAGRAELVLVGRVAGTERRVPLSEAAVGEARNLLFSLRYFEEFSGEFALPAGFQPSRVLVSLVPADPAAPRIDENFEWRRILDSGVTADEVRE